VSLLEVEDLRATYGQGHVLHGISFAVEEGQIVSILGPNGAGKTTTLRAVSGTVQTTGRIALDGHDIQGEAPDKIARRGIAHVPEGRGTFTELTVEENLRVGGYTRKDGLRDDIARVYKWFPRLSERRAQHAGSLSGGEQQMLAVSRALMLRPRLLLLDEPSFGLAPLIVVEIFRILRRINEDEKVSILLVEQNAALALDLADHAYVLETGHVVMSGPSAVVKNDENIRKSYLGY